MPRWLARTAIGVAIAAAFAIAFACTPPRGPRSMRQFRPARLAALEVGLWQAYDAKERVRLFTRLVAMLREQHRYSWAIASLEAFHLAPAAVRFADRTAGDDAVLRDLEAAYGKARSWTGAAFDPHAVARAELAWWVARRTAGQNGPEQVGRLIAEEYALLYETTPENVGAAALLRAQAAALRDAQAGRPDWTEIGRVLRASYDELLAALARANV